MLPRPFEFAQVVGITERMQAFEIKVGIQKRRCALQAMLCVYLGKRSRLTI